MSWPTPQDYNEAIQSPSLNFGDLELKGGRVETTSLGLPRPISGGFASVYRVSCGQREWAVRCFLREFLDQQHRYEAISQHLSATKLPYMVGFDFLPQGIKVKGKWYPILKMEWVKGELLHKYIKRNLHNPQVLTDLADQWVAMLNALQVAKIAHGDLQHGNILVANNALRLIDYDGIYVPALAGQSSHEVGHRNYQHPQRTPFDFGPKIDGFAAWVIYISLLALSIDSSLWDKAKAGDENLLFRREDYDEPHNSRILTLLSKHTDQRLYALANFFQSILYGNLAQLPPLDGQAVIQRAGASSLGAAVNGHATGGVPSWLQDHIPTPRTDKNDTPGDANLMVDSTWVLDHLTSPAISAQKLLEAEILKPRLAILTYVVICSIVVALNFIWLHSTILVIAPILFFGAFISALLQHLYRQSPIVATMLELSTKEEEQTRRLRASQRKIKSLETKKSEVLKKQKEEDQAINSQRAALQTKEQHEIGRVDARLSAETGAANAQRQEIGRKEAAALQKIQASFGGEVTRLNSQISTLSQAEASEMSNALNALRKRVITSYLLSHQISQANVQGIGDTLKARLRAAGVKTAADIEYANVRRIEGIGERKARALLAWRDQLASFANAPGALSVTEMNAIKSKYHLQRRQLESQRDASMQRLNAEVLAIKAQFAKEIMEVSEKQKTSQDKAGQEIQSISAQYTIHYAALTQTKAIMESGANEQCQALNEEIDELRRKMGERHWQLIRIRRDLMSYSDVSFRKYLRMVAGY